MASNKTRPSGKPLNDKTRRAKPRIVIDTTTEIKQQADKQAGYAGFGSTAAYIIYLIKKDGEPKQ
jgi:hypothetical protein